MASVLLFAFLATAGAAAAASWNASDPASIAFVCDAHDACCAPYIAMARLAAKHVNEMDSSIVPEIANLPGGMPQLSIEEVLSSSHDAYEKVRAYYASAGTHAVAVAGIPETEECEALAPLFSMLDVPAFTVSAAGALGLQGSTPDEYGNIYRMLAPNDEILKVLSGFMEYFNFTQAAVLYDPSVHEETRIRKDLADHPSGVFKPYPVDSFTESGVAEVIGNVADTGVQTFILIFQRPATMKTFVRFAYNKGLAGGKTSAKGFVWIAAGGYMPWSYVDAHPENYLGMFSVQQHTYDDDRLHLMEDIWSEGMPETCKLAPEEIPFTIPHRNHLPYTECLGLASSYDTVVAVAKGLATKLGDRRLGGTTSLDADCINSRASALNQALHEGVAFTGLSGPVDRSGKPWAEKNGRWEIANLQSAVEGAQAAILYEWTAAGGFGDPRRLRRLGGSSGSIGGVDPSCRYLWPGNLCTKPEGIIHSPCEYVDCGSHGECVSRPALGRKMGWCKCDDAYIGVRCETHYGVYRLSDHPGIDAYVPTTVMVSAFVKSFFGIDDKFPYSYSLRFGVNLHWTDERNMHLIKGDYTYSEAMSLSEEGMLWLPKFTVSDATKDKRETGTLHLGEGGKMEFLVEVDAAIELELEWALFPFDDHELGLHIGSDNGHDVEFQLLDCSGELKIPKAAEACEGIKRSGMPSLPEDTLERHWNKAWFASSSAAKLKDHWEVELLLTVTRDVQAFLLRSLLPSCFLVSISWAGFFISPKQLMPRFASAFISFLSLQSFKNKLQGETPGGGAELTWVDVYISVVGLLMVFAVLENIYAQFVNEHYSEKCALRIDVTSRFVFPLSYFVLCVFLLLTRRQVMMAYVVSHVYLLLFALSFIALAVEDAFVFRGRLMTSEAKRISALRRRQPAHEPLEISLSFTERDIKSFFEALDGDNSGSVSLAEILPWVTKYFAVKAEDLQTMEAKCREVAGPHCDTVQASDLKGVLKKVIDVAVNKMDPERNASKENPVLLAVDRPPVDQEERPL